MSEEIKNYETAEVSTRRQCAEKLHNEIMYNADMVSNYLYELCKDLKRMRDEHLYFELGYGTFDDYVEKDVGIRKRQAYTYISVYERFGDTFLQAHTRLGITKLSLLTEVPAAERADFEESNDLENMSTREIKDIVDKFKTQGEQLSLLTDERDQAKTEADDLSQKASDAQAAKDAAEQERREAEERLAKANDRIAELEKAEPDAEAIERIRKEAEKKAQKELKDKLKAETEKAVAAAKAEYEKKITAARTEGEKAGAEKVKDGLESLEKEKADAIRRAEELEKKLKVSSNQDMALFAFLFENYQECFNKLCGCIKKIEASDGETAGKLRGALAKVMDTMRQDEILKG